MKKLKELMAITEGVTPVSEMMPTEKQPGEVVFRTGVGVATNTVRLQGRISELEKSLAAAIKAVPLNIQLEEICENPWHSRAVIDSEQLRLLAESMRVSGLLQPVLVRAHPNEIGKYQLIAGLRRLHAARLLGWNYIEAKVKDVSDAEMAMLSLTENLSPIPLSESEAGTSLVRAGSLLASRGLAAENFGISRSRLHELLETQKLP